LSNRTRIARLCVFAAGIASLPGAVRTTRAAGPGFLSAAPVGPERAAEVGFRLDRPSKGDLRLWHAIEGIATASDATGVSRSPTLRRLWDWARTSPHVLRIEIVAPSRIAAGMAGLFRVESVDPAGLRHVAVISICPDNIQRAKASAGPNSALFFVRFEGLTEAERYAEVLAHELAHAEYFLESVERLAELQAAQQAIQAALTRTRRAREEGVEDLVRESEKPLAVMAASEPHAESLEADVVRELGRRAP
jgi:hypothetical protein